MIKSKCRAQAVSHLSIDTEITDVNKQINNAGWNFRDIDCIVSEKRARVNGITSIPTLQIPLFLYQFSTKFTTFSFESGEKRPFCV